MEAFRAAAIAALHRRRTITLDALEQEHQLLAARLAIMSDEPDADLEAMTLWRRLGVDDAAGVPALDVDAVRALRPA